MGTQEITAQTVDALFTGYDDALDPTAGFVAFVWEMRRETLETLEGPTDSDAYAQLLGDISYAVRQTDWHRAADKGGARAAAHAFIEEYHSDLVEALRDSLDSD